MRRLIFLLTAPMLVAGLLAAPASASTWTTDHGDNQRSGYNPAETPYRALSKAWNTVLDGKVYASPIVVGSTVIVATENNTVYSFMADTGALRWRRHLRTAAPTSSLACSGNVSPVSGITGTPAYDPGTNRIFLVTNTADAQNRAFHEVWGVSATSGAVAMTRRVSVPGQAENAEQQRGALAVSNGNVYLPFGGLAGDCGQYRGAVISLKANGQLGATAYVVPTARMGGIWAPGGPVVWKDGSIFVAVGNGASTSGPYDYSDSVTRISPTSTRLDYFAPTSWASDNASDLDLGSLTPALTSSGYILQAGKSGKGYVLRADHLGGIGGQVYTAALCTAFGVSAVTGTTVYLPCTDGLSRVEVRPDGSFVRVWRSTAASSSPVAGPGALYSVNGSNLVAINARNGAQLGSLALGSSTTRFTTPALAGNKVFVATTTSLVAVKVG
jgi:outer membrane protein assembly factor BamB